MLKNLESIGKLFAFAIPNRNKVDKRRYSEVGIKQKQLQSKRKIMKLAKIVKAKSLRATLLAMPIGEEQVIPQSVWPTASVRKRACELKKEGHLFKVCNYRVVDTFVTRIK